VTVSSSAENGRAAVPTRPWRGVSARHRTAERRERLVEAGLTVFSARGYQLASLAEVCAAAGLIKRYFYESFADREALLLALAERIADDALAAVGAALDPAVVGDDLTPGDAFGRALDAFVDALVADARRARVLIVETVGVSPAVEDRRREIIDRLVATVRQILWPTLAPTGPAAVDADLTSRAIVGATHELLIGFVRGELSIDRRRLVDHLTTLSVAAAAVHSGERVRPDPIGRASSDGVWRSS
jgi:AcrR family transcriptional regulator